jgi:hypothetical protein
MQLFAASARKRLGALTGGALGAELVRTEDERMRALGVVNPERWSAVYTPGFT